MDIAEIRRRNLRKWIDEDPASNGVVRAWCDYYSQRLAPNEAPFNPTYIRQIAPKSGTPHRDIGEKVARKIERALGKPEGSMDRLIRLVEEPQPAGEHEEIIRRYSALPPELQLLVQAILGMKAGADLPKGAGDAIGLAVKLASPSDRGTGRSGAAS